MRTSEQYWKSYFQRKATLVEEIDGKVIVKVYHDEGYLQELLAVYHIHGEIVHSPLWWEPDLTHMLTLVDEQCVPVLEALRLNCFRDPYKGAAAANFQQQLREKAEDGSEPVFRLKFLPQPEHLELLDFAVEHNSEPAATQPTCEADKHDEPLDL